MARGGRREGAGRRSGWNHPETQTIRVPVVFSEQLLEIARRLDAGESIDSVSKSIEGDEIDFYTREEIEDAAQQVLLDTEATRNGKDKGAVRRGLLALLRLLG